MLRGGLADGKRSGAQRRLWRAGPLVFFGTRLKTFLTDGSAGTLGTVEVLPPRIPPAAFRKRVVCASFNPGAYGCEQTSDGKRETLAAPALPLPPWATASKKAAKVTESTAVPM